MHLPGVGPSFPGLEQPMTVAPPVASGLAPAMAGDRLSVETPGLNPPAPSPQPEEPSAFDKVGQALRVAGVFAVPAVAGAGLGLGVAALAGGSLGIGAAIGAGIGIAGLMAIFWGMGRHWH